MCIHYPQTIFVYVAAELYSRKLKKKACTSPLVFTNFQISVCMPHEATFTDYTTGNIKALLCSSVLHSFTKHCASWLICMLHLLVENL